MRFRLRFVLAVFLFAALNYALAWLYLDKKVDGDLELENRNVLLSYEASPKCDVLLLGSSLVERPFSAVPPQFDNVKIKCLACWSAMISDQLVLVNEVVRQEPSTIVIGVGPRDFADTRWIHPDQTLIFRTLVSINSVPRYWFLFGNGLDNRLEFFSNRLFPLYRNRRKIQKFLFSELTPITHGEVPITLKVADDRTVALQYECFQKLLSSAKTKSGRVVVVNMPVSETALAQLPGGFYANYMSKVRVACDKSQIPFFDANTHQFSAEDFSDVMHLNANGARKWNSMLNHAVGASHPKKD